MDISIYQEAFLNYLQSQNIVKEPKNLYQPIDYMLQLGGKQIRPVLTLLAAETFSDNFTDALSAALAIETFHNFTLIHDDIMDDAPLRRGQQTVHEKWDLNTGILSGDAMLVLAYQCFENYEPLIFQNLAKLFSKTAIEVFDGQQLDVDFETRNNVTINEYINMIRLKTAVLIAAALKMGAIIAKAGKNNANLIYEYGIYLGIAFQLQDDYLDTYGNPETFGKQIGGDIIENKKTILYIKTLELASDSDKKILFSLYNQKNKTSTSKIKEVTRLFNKYKIPTFIKGEIKKYTQKAFIIVQQLEVSLENKDKLTSFGFRLMDRTV